MSKKVVSQTEVQKLKECNQLNELINDRDFFAEALHEMYHMYNSYGLPLPKDYNKNFKMLKEIENELLHDFGIPKRFTKSKSNKSSKSKSNKSSKSN